MYCLHCTACRYSRNAWGFGWYRRYKRNYAPGWSQPSKFIGHKRHLLEAPADSDSDLQQEQQQQAHQQQQQQRSRGMGVSRQLQQVPAAAVPPTQQLQNETILVPPCLLSSTYYKNTCKQCNYSWLAVRVTVTPLRRGLLNFTASDNPLGFNAPTLAVTPGGSIVVVASYSGPNNHPNSSAPAYPGTCEEEEEGRERQ